MSSGAIQNCGTRIRISGGDGRHRNADASLSRRAWRLRGRGFGRANATQVAIDAQQPKALAKALLAAASERGPTYRVLVERHGRPRFERCFGSAELRGAGPELTVVVSVDEWVLRDELGLSGSIRLRGSSPTASSVSERWVGTALTVQMLLDEYN
jgi:hypothetical protein